jgi:DNA-directed RNA polymerase subunit beta'
MSVLDPERVMRTLEERVSDKIKSFFPLTGKKHSLVVRDVYTDKEVDVDDVHDQKRARLRGKTWSTGVYGNLDLVDNATGKVLDRSDGVKLLSLPKITRRYSYIIEGAEYQADNQWRLKSGVYAREKANGELETQFNLAKGRGFRMEFDPPKRRFLISYGTANVPLLPVLQAMGVPDDQIRKAWGDQVYAAAAAQKGKGQLVKLAKALEPYKPVENDTDAIPVIRAAYDNTVLNADTTAITLGKPYERVTGEALLSSANKLLGISRGEREVDNRDSLRFKELWSIEDHIPERIQNSGKRIRLKMMNNLDRKDQVRSIVTNDVFNVPVKAFFTSTSLSQQTSQVNPLDMLGGFLRTTIMGPGGISNENAVGVDAKMIDSSFLGFVDPVHTPEGSKSGVSGHLALGVSKRGVEPTIRVWDTQAKVFADKTPTELARKSLAFADQYDFEKGKEPRPRGKVVTVIPSGGTDPEMVDPKDVGYIMQSPKTVFSMTANLVPFVASDQSNRAGMATRHMEQAISLKSREEPLVQTVSGNPNERYGTWEKIVGSLNSHAAPLSGKVESITDDAITLIGEDKKRHVVQLYDNFPLNDAKAFISSYPTVKVGDTVEKGQLLADTNFTKNGTLSIGTNLRIAFLPYKGLVFEDGIVISETASQKLLSEHLHKSRAYLDTEMYLGLKKFRANYPGVVTEENAKKLDEDGVIKKGELVKPGDVIMTILQKSDPSSEQLMLKGIHKALVRPWKNKSVTWDKPYSGVVTEVVRNGKEVQAFIKTEEPADIGDKLCFAPDHEILTNAGWRAVADVEMGDLVASLSPRTGCLEYVPVAATYAYDCEKEPLYVLETTQVSMAVTPQHSLWAEPRDKSRGLYEAKDLVGKRYRLQQDGVWLGSERDVFVFPEMEVSAGQGGVGTRVLPAFEMPMDTFLMLLGMYLSEGHCYASRTNGDYYLEITQIKSGSRQQMLSALQAADVKFADLGDRIRLTGKQIWYYFHVFGLSYEKYIPDWVFDLSSRQQAILYRWLMWGDGCTTHSSHVYTTTSRRLADGVQRLLLHIGMAGRVVRFEAREGKIKGKPYQFRTCYKVQVIRTKLRPTINHGHSKAQSGQTEGYVEYTGPVFCVTLERNHILYTRRNGKVHWSGNSGRHGNKGIITAVLPDEEMPRDKDGNPLEIIVNPAGVPGRINLGQVLETSLAKVADKRGEPYAVENFQPVDSKKIIQVRGHWRTVKKETGEVSRTWVDPHEREVGYHELVKQELFDHKVSETDELFDGVTGKSLGQVLVGKQYILKLMHQIDKKLSARSHGYGNQYDQNLQPKGGGKAGAQRYGELGYYAMLAHGAVHNLREAATYKGDKQQDEVWTALQVGEPLPTPKPSFAYEKFLAYLNAVGINVDKEGNELIVKPFTDPLILAQSNGELADASKVVRGKDLKPEKGGLFDEQVTGGPGGKNWSHIVLASRMPNPLFEKAIVSLLGLREADYDAVIAGENGFTKDGQLVVADDADLIGPGAIVERLKKIDVDKELATALESVKTARRTELDRANKKVKYLRALKNTELSADLAYTLGNLPVLPPVFRPVSAMEGGDLNIDGLNMLYRDVALLNGKLKEAEGVLPDEAVSSLRKDLYDAVDALMGTRPGSEEGVTTDGQPKPPGILTILSGRSSPKNSYFHDKLMDRPQDLSMRSVIVPDMTLGLDEVGIPRKGAMKVYRPFVVRELVRMGYTPLQAREEVEKKTSLANRALDVAVSQRPVLFKRDPVLHKFGIMAFRPKLHDELAIKIHPLVTGGFNADFDGDAMAIFVPVSQEAVQEAYRMLPSNNLYNAATGKVMYQPSMESQLGLYLMTQFGKETGKKYGSVKDLLDDVKAGKALATDVVTVDGKKTTAGRLSFNNALPESVRDDAYLTDPSWIMGDKNLQKVMRTIATKQPGEFATAIDRIKDLGFNYSYDIGFSFDLNDFNTLRDVRQTALKKAEVEVLKIRSSKLSPAQQEAKIVDIYTQATKDMGVEARKVLGAKGNKLFAMSQAGVKPSWPQLQQMVLAPMLLQNASGRTIPVPVTKSYAEGLDTAGYWVASSGARKGLVEKVLQVQEPGALSKQIVNTVVPYVVTNSDCGTKTGIALDVDDSDLVDRYVAKDTALERGGVLSAGTLITSSVVANLKANKITRVVARSPMKCESAKGLCSKCYGLSDGGQPLAIGTNIGVLAGQAIGERGTQLSMKAFHTGGLAGSGSSVVGGLGRLSELLKMPKILPNKATISHVSGDISKIEKSPVGGWDVSVGSETHYIPASRELLVQKGDKVKRGQQLSSGSIDPRELLDQTNIDTVQRYIADEIHKVYASEGIKRRNVEVVTKALTNLAQVEDPGDNDQFIRGDFISASHAQALNREKQYTNPIQVSPVLRGTETLALDQSEDWMARMQYRELKKTLTRAANENWKSNIHGVHPTPAIAYGAEFGRNLTGEGPY